VRYTTGGSIRTSTRSSTKALVEKGELDRRTNYYTITARGHRELEARRKWEDQYVSDFRPESK